MPKFNEVRRLIVYISNFGRVAFAVINHADIDDVKKRVTIGWPPCQPSDMILMEVSQRAYDMFHYISGLYGYLCVCEIYVNLIWYLYLFTLPAQRMEYSENTMQTIAFDILIYCEWLGINHK